jgi:heme a synthase
MDASGRPVYPWAMTADRRAVGYWLLAVAAIVIGMVAIGGLTRLTGSGLSITQWDLLVGVVPPLSDAQWHTAFAKYQQIPQYRLENQGMTLDGFKAIFWWEWTHRLLGRIVGAAFAVPCLWFAWTGQIARREWPRMAILFVLGGLQGLVGWRMVQSGLDGRVSVAPHWLAIHLGMAMILLGTLLWTAFDYLRGPAEPRARWSLGFVALVYGQMLLGALVAGLHGGLIYNTWPSMDGHVFPEGPFGWLSPFEDPGLAQFDHRLGAYAVLAAALTLAFRIRTRPALIVAAVALFQLVLGIFTLLMQAPIDLAVAHQLTAVALFSAAVWQAHDRAHAFSA